MYSCAMFIMSDYYVYIRMTMQKKADWKRLVRK